MSDTPETDAVENEWRESFDEGFGQKEMAILARKLERERDQARLEATRYRNLAMELANQTND